MILRFMQRDPAWRCAPWMTAWAAVGALVYSFTEIPLLLAAVAYNGVLALACYRTTSFEAYLPISGRDLFMVRLLSVLSMVWLPAAAACAILTFTGNPEVTAGEVTLIAAVLSVGAMVGLTLRIKEIYPPPGLAMLWLFGVEAAGWGVIALAMILRGPGIAAVICMAIAAGLGVNAWQSVPEAFQIAPMEASVPKRKARVATPVTPWWPILRTIGPYLLGPLILAAVFCALSWFLGEWSYQVYFLSFFSPFTIASAQQWSLALPVSRRSMLALATVPLLLALVCTSEFGFLTGNTPAGKDLVHRSAEPREIVVNPAFWMPALGGHVPPVQAPWGEQAQPAPLRILGLTLYNPYFVGPGNSPQFEQWQFARATAYIYGRPVAPHTKTPGRGPTPIVARPRMQILYLAAILSLALFCIWLAELQLSYRLYRMAPNVRNSLAIAATIAIILIPTVIDLMAGTRDFSRSAMEAVLLAISRRLPANLLLVTIAALLPLAALWWIVERQASVAEIPATYPSQNCFGRSGSKE